ncbi:TetR/AcrR family transcriptional regulator [Gordonia sp. TBRC 11910]|uniref:TetR/AcrR family transcriptional regulator n=1 Tax=Gordonia asplenii TaxID=2725283 RepID=A0A848KVS9_9ACTN|nr:TetR/AcrR family transcriptional regulator [Gordonia asplenii]NMO00291.1 TetR/AcrR family transcriptional regulator [Gordonia asplenii]
MTTSKRGRPRLTDRRRSGATPEEEILDAAAELFAANGFARTSTRAIAEAVGVRQASLYHHFATKDDILDSLLVRTVDTPLRLAHWLSASEHPAAQRLWAMAWFDAHQLLASKWNLGVLLQLPETRDPKFAQFFGKRSALRAAYVELARDVGGDLHARLPFHFVEAAIQLRVEEARWVADVGPAAVACGIADSVLRTVGYVGDVGGVRAGGAALLTEFENQ